MYRCGVPGCPEFVRSGSRCLVHRRKQFRGYGGDWPRRARAQVMASPICVDCGATSDLTADHIRPGDPSSPLATRCRSCNSRRVRR